jgi:hypothetical protein
MRTNQIEGCEIADTFVKRRRTLEIGEQESQRGDLQTLVDIEIVGLVDVAECLVAEDALRGDERLALADQVVERVGTRMPVWLSSDNATGPGRSVVVCVGA